MSVPLQVNGTTESDVAARPKPKPLGPTDKQIESRTTDGRRRITPIFIPPDAEESRDEQNHKTIQAVSSNSNLLLLCCARAMLPAKGWVNNHMRVTHQNG